MLKATPRRTAPLALVLASAVFLGGCSPQEALDKVKARLGLSKPAAPAPAVQLEAPKSSLRAAGAYKPYQDPSGLFTCEAPAAWPPSSDGATETPNVSFTLRTPLPDKPKEAAVFSLSVYFYGPGNEQFASAEDYVKRNTQALPGAEVGPVSQVKLPAGPARRWSAVLPTMGFPEAITERKVKETFMVLPAAKGFFVLGYTSPADQHDLHQAHFSRLLDTFAPR